MKNLFIVIVPLCFFISLSTCSLSTEKDDAQKIAESFLNERIINGGFEGKKEYYSDFFWKNANVEDWNNLKTAVNNTLGNLQKYSLLTWTVKSGSFIGQLSGTYVVLLYKMEYEKGNGQEKLTMYKSSKGKDFKILGHRIITPKKKIE